uniref:Uncharacterized protein n=1 Tax=Zea mays TaxID=4577 RepID=B7ZZ81_MAIZE|nr:unknown [Zea mays]
MSNIVSVHNNKTSSPEWHDLKANAILMFQFFWRPLVDENPLCIT